jgi:hypothetical protein
VSESQLVHICAIYWCIDNSKLLKHLLLNIFILIKV